MPPEVEGVALRGDDGALCAHHPQPDPAQVPQVEHVVELGWCWQEFLLGALPQLPCDRNQFLDQIDDILGETLLLVEVTLGYRPEDVIDGVVSGNGAVEGDKMSLQSVGDVIPPSPRMVHGCHVLDVLQGGEVSRSL